MMTDESFRLLMDEYSALVHFLLPTIKDGENVTQFRARCQIVLSESLARAEIIRRMSHAK